MLVIPHKNILMINKLDSTFRMHTVLSLVNQNIYIMALTSEITGASKSSVYWGIHNNRLYTAMTVGTVNKLIPTNTFTFIHTSKS